MMLAFQRGIGINQIIVLNDVGPTKHGVESVSGFVHLIGILIGLPTEFLAAETDRPHQVQHGNKSQLYCDRIFAFNLIRDQSSSKLSWHEECLVNGEVARGERAHDGSRGVLDRTQNPVSRNGTPTPD